MLNALLAMIQTQLGSKGFLLASLLPVLLFAFGNSLMLYQHWDKARTWINTLNTIQEKALLATVLIAAIISVAYVFSTLGATLLELLEGKKGPLLWAAPLLYRIEWGKLRKLEKLYHDRGYELTRIERALNGDAGRAILGWMDQLRQARDMGVSTGRCDPSWQKSSDAHTVRRVLRRRRYGLHISYEDLQLAIAALARLLRANSANLRTDEASKILDGAHQVLQEAIYFARDRCEFERIRLYNARQFSYPAVAPTRERTSNNMLAPTSMGNIGRTMRSYALTRYKLDLDIFWSRLQNSVQGSKDFFNVLQDVKIQLDFLVALVWLTGLFTVIWAPLLLFFFKSSVLEFVLVGSVGFLTVAFYSLACQSNRVFADLMRSAVDLFRFKLLSDLRLPLPNGYHEERVLWEELGNMTGFAREKAILYRHSGT